MRVRADSVEETTISTPGMGNLFLAGETAGNRPFSVIGDGSECYYRVEMEDLLRWEIGSATYHSSSNSLTRDEVFTNSLGTTDKVNLTGVCTVYLTLLSREIDSIASATVAFLPLTTGEITDDGSPVLVADPEGQCVGVPVT